MRTYNKLLACAVGATLLSFAVATGPALSAEYSIKVAYENNPGEPFDLACQEWAKLFKEKTGGKGELLLYPSSQLGSKKDVMEQMTMGAGIVTLTDGAFFADYIPDFAILMGPYLGKDYTDVIKLSNTPWFNEMATKLEGQGFHILAANWLYGTRHMVTKKPVHTPEDLKGMKIRVPNARIQIEAMKEMGGTPTPMPLAEVYPALTTGVIDGAENPIPVLYGQKHHEPAKYLILTGHLDNITNITISNEYYQKLPDDIKTALTESCKEAGDFMTALILKNEKEVIEKMKAEGVTVIEVDRNLFREASKGTYSKFPEWTPGLYDKLQGYLK
ncbi:MAG: C4-dicarboxylate TRAP transporter substrate-binding protein [Methylobacteriaceae bacterium]|jgi:tripartite ATP-independent transporter DctP family solute receptor|nr:C4-dicarboxylate TRAP transporter substrate-binding protein [Methylobacteriaceae bacterium]